MSYIIPQVAEKSKGLWIGGEGAIIILVKMSRFIVRILGNIIGLYVADWLIPGVIIQGGWQSFAIAGGTLGLLNIIVKPVLKVLATPLIILSLGLFIIVINALLLWLVDYVFDFVIITDIATLIWATITIGIINLFTNKKFIP